ncbi:flagellar hook-length control protein FliK [Vreelandella subglaciescola]|uniref:Hook-length control protein FliK n=1 Tax=Vreelandella subglaciescola TaxID=29571 RepID=A0A1M7HGD2_9GAMM|nr:flagellar hook-length control protein FliK [Halomonas subglaciescola]SHM27509.1 hook-length control protein FliK [Halomonas subglaciescola]
MSTITPLIDTLLHQVLGKGGNVAPKELNVPVRPIDPGDGPRALRSDSRLDARADPRLGELNRLPPQPDALRTAGRGDGTAASAPGSTQTHFSPAARSIADLLVRFPAPPSVLRTPAPLMSTAEPPAPQVLAQRIEASVRDSGLFYEAHLKRWFQGDMPRQQLLREPQMQPGVRPLPMADPAAAGARAVAPASSASAAPALIQNPLVANAPPLLLPTPVPFILPGHSLPAAALPTSAAGAQGGSGPVLPGSVLLPTVATASGHTATTTAAAMPPPQSAVPPMEGARAEVAGMRDMLEMAAAHKSRDVVHESLQSLVRQQLEMLVAPTIRWEGDVWAGIFMALVVNLPKRPDEQNAEQESARDESQEGWQSDIRLEVPSLGAFEASLRLYKNTLSVDLTTSSAEVHECLEEGLSRLENRLSALDLQRVSVSAHYLSEADDE